jgi:plastocyanin
MRVRRRAALLIACAAMLLFAACGNAYNNDSAGTTSVTLEAFDFYFQPTTLAGNLGGQLDLTLTNNGENTHSFTSPDLDVEFEVSSGESASETISLPEEPGAYNFFCKYHPEDMKGVVTVGNSNEEPADDNPGTQDGDDNNIDDTPTDTSTTSTDSGY